MATLTLTELVTALTEAETLQQMLDLLQANPQPFPTDSWEADSVPQVLLQAMSNLLAKLSQQQANVAMSGFLDYAASRSLQYTSGPRVGTSPWLDLLGAQFFQLLRQEAQSTVGSFKLFATSPVTLAAGRTLQVADNANPAHRYSVTLESATTIQIAGTVIEGFAAESPGSAWNIGINAVLALTQAIPGVTVTNPANSGSTTWITFAGANIESDASYQARLQNQWNALSTGSPEPIWRNWCFTASAEVRTAFTVPTGFGTVNVVVYGDMAAVSSDGLDAIETYVTARIPNCQTLAPGTPRNATGLTVFARVTMYGPAASQTSAEAAALTALQALITGTPIGGNAIGGSNYGVASSSFVDAVVDAVEALGITNVVVAISDDDGTSYTEADFLMPADGDGVPVIAQYDQDGSPASLVFEWISV